MTDTLPVIERLSLVSPLGVRFRDEATGAIVCDGLNVMAYPKRIPELKVQAVANSLGVYLFRNVPGLRDFEHGTGNTDFWQKSQPKNDFFIEVVDTERRFQSFRFPVKLPRHGIFSWQCGENPPSPPSVPEIVPLYSATTRPVPDGMAVIRAQLWNPVAQTYAAGAVLEALVPKRPPVRGFTDTSGRVALLFPYPEPVEFLFGSRSPTSPVEPLSKQSWSVQLQAAYEPQDPKQPIPNLCTILMQRPAHLWEDEAHTKPFQGEKLHFGQELVVRSTDSKESVLFITPAGKPT